MFDSLGLGELGVLLVLALFVFGPDRLPTLAADLGRALRRIRLWFLEVTSEVRSDLGPELGDLGSELRQLRPREMAARLLDEDDATSHVR